MVVKSQSENSMGTRWPRNWRYLCNNIWLYIFEKNIKKQKISNHAIGFILRHLQNMLKYIWNKYNIIKLSKLYNVLRNANEMKNNN